MMVPLTRVARVRAWTRTGSRPQRPGRCVSAVSPQPDAGLRGGLRSPDLLHVAQALWPAELSGEVALLEGFQPPTTRSEVERSDALSYSGAWKGVPVLPRLL